MHSKLKSERKEKNHQIKHTFGTEGCNFILHSLNPHQALISVMFDEDLLAKKGLDTWVVFIRKVSQDFKDLMGSRELVFLQSIVPPLVSGNILMKNVPFTSASEQ